MSLPEGLKLYSRVEMSAGQMVEDVRLAVNGKVPVHHYGRMGGMIPTPDEVVENLKINYNRKLSYERNYRNKGNNQT